MDRKSVGRQVQGYVLTGDKIVERRSTYCRSGKCFRKRKLLELTELSGRHDMMTPRQQKHGDPGRSLVRQDITCQEERPHSI